MSILSPELAYEPFPPERINSRRTILLGAKSGSRAVAGYLSQLGMPVPSHCLPRMVRHIRTLAAELGRPLREEEVRSLV